jgi:hypothetical protein
VPAGLVRNSLGILDTCDPARTGFATSAGETAILDDYPFLSHRVGHEVLPNIEAI